MTDDNEPLQFRDPLPEGVIEVPLTISATLLLDTRDEAFADVGTVNLARYVADTFVVADLADGTDCAFPGETELVTDSVIVQSIWRASPPMSNRRGRGQKTERLVEILSELRTAHTFLAAAQVQQRSSGANQNAVTYWERRVEELEQERDKLRGSLTTLSRAATVHPVAG